MPGSGPRRPARRGSARSDFGRSGSWRGGGSRRDVSGAGEGSSGPRDLHGPTVRRPRQPRRNSIRQMRSIAFPSTAWLPIAEGCNPARAAPGNPHRRFVVSSRRPLREVRVVRANRKVIQGSELINTSDCAGIVRSRVRSAPVRDQRRSIPVLPNMPAPPCAARTGSASGVAVDAPARRGAIHDGWRLGGFR